MAYTKTFEERNVGFSIANENLLKTFNALQIKHLGNDTPFIFEFKKENVRNKEDFLDGIKRFGNDWLNVKVSDRGEYVIMPAFRVQLNNQGFAYLEDFERDILAIEKKLGLEGIVDEDIVKKGLFLENEFALFINILTKTLAKCLETNGPVENSATKYFAIFEGLLSQFINLEMAETNLFLRLFGADENSSSMIEIGSKFDSWREKTLELIDSIYQINITKNCIQQSIEDIKTPKLKLIQHLHYRLKIIHNEKVKKIDYTKIRAEEGLYNIEKHILLSNPKLLPTRCCAIFTLPLNQIKKLQKKRCFVYDDLTLYYINSKHKEMVIPVENQKLFLKYIDPIEQETSNPELMSTNIHNKTVSMEEIQQHITEKDAHDIRIDFLTFEEKCKLICTILEGKKDKLIEGQLPWIRKLYEALNSVIWLQKNINYLDNITDKLGCLLFLYNFLDGDILNHYHESILEEAENACNDPLIKNTPLSLLGEKITTRNTLQIKRCKFSELHGQEFQKYAYKIINKNLVALEKRSQLRNGPRFFNIEALQHLGIRSSSQGKSVLTMTSTPRKEKCTQVPPKQNPLLVNPQTLALTFSNNSTSSDILVVPAQQSISPLIEENGLFYKVNTNNSERDKEAIFSILDMCRKDVVQILQDYIAVNEAVRELVSKECLEYFEYTSLPQSWNNCGLKSTSTIMKINETLSAVEKLAQQVSINVLKVMVNESDFSSLQKFNNRDLIEYIQKNNPKFLSHDEVASSYQAYASMRIMRLKVLAEFFSEINALNAYLVYRYFEKKDGFIYTPNVPCVLASLLRKLDVHLQFWIKTEQAQYKKLESFKCNGNASPVKNVLFTDTNAQIGYASFQQFSCELLAQKQDKTFLKKLLVTALSPNSRLNAEEKESIVRYFCFNNETISETGLKAKLSSINFAKSQLKQFDRKLHFGDLLIKKGEKFVLKQIINKLSKRLMQNPNVLVDETEIRDLIAIQVAKYCANNVNIAAEKLKQSWNQQNLEMTLQWNNTPYRFESLAIPGKPGSLRDYHLYKIPPDRMFYAFDPDNTHQAFFEETIAGDGECGFTCLGLSRHEFVQVLLKAVKHPENRKILAKEMLNHLNSLYLEEEAKWDKNVMTTDIQGILENKDRLTKDITIFIQKFSQLLRRSFSDYQPCINHIKNDANLYNLHKGDVDQLQKLVDNYNQCDSDILNICTTQNFCEYYVKQYHNTPLQLGKYAAQVYAKQKNISLYIYDKNICRIPFVLGFDKETSFIAHGNSQPIRMVYVHGGHYNRLRLNTKYDNISPKKLWKNYTDSFRTQIPLKLSTSLPQVKEAMADYIQRLTNMLANPTLLDSALTASQLKKIEQYSQEVALEQTFTEFQARRASIRKNWESDDAFSVMGFIKDLSTESSASVDLDNMVISPNEYLDEQNQTLLLMAVQQQIIPLVQCLLTLGASVATPSDSLLKLRINPKNALEDIPNTYYLKQKAKRVWRFVYVDEDKKTNLLKINEFPELLLLLEEFEASITDLAILEEKVRAILLPKHRLLYSTTPLLEAAKITKEIHLEGSLYTILIQQGLQEASPRSLELVSAYNLKKLSEDVFTQSLKNLLMQYHNDRTESFKTYPIFNETKKSLLGWLGWDRSKDRAIEFAKLMCILIEAEKTHDYQIALALCEKVIQLSKTLISSVLIKGASSITAKTDQYIKERPETYKAEIDNLRALQQKKIIKIESTNINDEIESLKLKLKLSEEKELSRDQKMYDLQEQVNLSRANLIVQTHSISINPTQNNLQHNSVYCNSYSLFGGSTSLEITPGLNPSPQLKEVINLLKENNWLSRDSSLEVNNFFAVLAWELNRINNNTHENLFDERKLRKECYLCFLKNKKIANDLNIALKNKNPRTFPSTRLTDYSYITFDPMDAKENDLVLIEGNGSVEGVLLCMKLGLEAIYFVKPDQDNNFIYSKATASGYIPDIAENEVKENGGNSPILFINLKSYYPIEISEIYFEEKKENGMQEDEASQFSFD